MHPYLSIFTDILKAMVSFPEEVLVNETQDEKGILLTVDTNPQDKGKIIGKQGETAKALRTIVRVIGAANNARVSVIING